jgi:ATP-dependent Zn protease
MTDRLRNFALWVIIVLLLLALFTLLQGQTQRIATGGIPFSQFLTEVDQGRVRDVVIQGPEISVPTQTAAASRPTRPAPTILHCSSASTRREY